MAFLFRFNYMAFGLWQKHTQARNHHKEELVEQLSIIVITLNEEKNILNILGDLKKQTFQDFQLIISDSNSTDRTEQLAQSMAGGFKDFVFTNCRQTLGPAYGRNHGVKFAKHELILFLDADTRIFDPEFLEKFLLYVSAHGLDAGAMYPKLMSDKQWAVWGGDLLNVGFFVTQFFSPSACGSCMFARKTMHQEIGGFREDVLLCEDCDYVRDGKRLDYKVKMVPLGFGFSERRFKQYGYVKTGLLYIKANMIRYYTGKSVSKKRISYQFDQYD